MNITLKNAGVIMGAVAGVLSSIIMFICWKMGYEQIANYQFYEKFIPFVFILFLLAGFQLRKNTSTFEFKQALQYSFSAYILHALIVAAATYVLYNVIDKTLTQQTLNIAVTRLQKSMQAMGATQKEINEMTKNTLESAGDTGLKRIFYGFGTGLIIDFIKSLILAAIVKKMLLLTLFNSKPYICHLCRFPLLYPLTTKQNHCRNYVHG
jgi:Protein of unknown function (DUF4199)